MELFKGLDPSRYKGLYGDDLIDALWEDSLLSETEVMARWKSLTPMARVLYARIRALREIDMR